MHLLSLVGEQPIPILLVHQALKPQRHLLVCTDKTEAVARQLHALLPHSELRTLPNAYQLAKIARHFQQETTPDTVFNLTGGTKPMAWAGYETALHQRADFVYLQSEGKKSILYRFRFQEGKLSQKAEQLLRLITLEDYLKAHGLEVVPSNPLVNPQEVAIYHFLRDECDQCLHNLKYPAFEIDFFVQRGNQAAVIEAKSGLSKIGRKREAIDQLTTITGREHLGTYTGRIWVTSRTPGQQLCELADAYQIKIVTVHLEQHAGRFRLTADSKTRLAQALDAVLGEREPRSFPTSQSSIPVITPTAHPQLLSTP